MALTEKKKNWERTRARTRREQGLCANCNNDALPGETRCGDCLRSSTQVTINQAKDRGTRHMRKVLLSKVLPNPWQPRKTVDDEYIKELANDIQAAGRLLQEPLTRPVGDGAYELAFGHSRIAALRLLH